MSEYRNGKYPIRSTARIFRDSDGNACTFDYLIAAEPGTVKEMVFKLEEKQELWKHVTNW
jgi:hypothetical protein